MGTLEDPLGDHLGSAPQTETSREQVFAVLINQARRGCRARARKSVWRRRGVPYFGAMSAKPQRRLPHRAHRRVASLRRGAPLRQGGDFPVPRLATWSPAVRFIPRKNRATGRLQDEAKNTNTLLNGARRRPRVDYRALQRRPPPGVARQMESCIAWGPYNDWFSTGEFCAQPFSAAGGSLFRPSPAGTGGAYPIASAFFSEPPMKHLCVKL